MAPRVGGATIDFESYLGGASFGSIAGHNTFGPVIFGFQGGGTSGLVLSAAYVATQSGAVSNGSAYYVHGSDTSRIVLSLASTGPFALTSFDLARAGNTAVFDVTVTGFRAAGGTITETVGTPPISVFGFGTKTFGAGWSGLSSVEITVNAPTYHAAFDNFVINGSPSNVPDAGSTAILLGVALLALVPIAQRRKQE